MESVTTQVRSWLRKCELVPLDPKGFAACALVVDFKKISEINEHLKNIKNWGRTFTWPPDRWVIGEDGAGNYFVVSKNDPFGAVEFFDHEWLRFEVEHSSLREFVDYCLTVERANRRGPTHPATA
jgi:hypothetical protein